MLCDARLARDVAYFLDPALRWRHVVTIRIAASETKGTWLDNTATDTVSLSHAYLDDHSLVHLRYSVNIASAGRGWDVLDQAAELRDAALDQYTAWGVVVDSDCDLEHGDAGRTGGGGGGAAPGGTSH